MVDFRLIPGIFIASSVEKFQG